MSYGIQIKNENGYDLISSRFRHFGLMEEKIVPYSSYVFSQGKLRYNTIIRDTTGDYLTVPSHLTYVDPPIVFTKGVLTGGAGHNTNLVTTGQKLFKKTQVRGYQIENHDFHLRCFHRLTIDEYAERGDYGIQVFNEHPEGSTARAKTFSSNFIQPRIRKIDASANGSHLTFNLSSRVPPTGWIDYTNEIRTATNISSMYGIALFLDDPALTWSSTFCNQAIHSGDWSNNSSHTTRCHVGILNNHFVIAAKSDSISKSLSKQNIRFYGTILLAYD